MGIQGIVRESNLTDENKDFEVILVEDGSSQTSEKVYEDYSSRLTIQYYYKANSGPGPSRNFGFERARGEYFVVFDSDCLIPDHYFESVEKFFRTNLKEFFIQVSNFGKGRALVGKVHPGEVKVTHWFPAFFLLGIILLPILFLIFPALALFGVATYCIYF
ncbi:MAG: glycosyltransferase family 2 protein [Flammeovirgaceae bacterium]|nr:glycosyltransferase family 2 protein [Flammeovirgaceae bacterium]